MGKPTGFIEYTRVSTLNRPPLERLNDWNEFHVEIPLEERMCQGARCMNCGTPFCHSGILLNGMISGCPLNNLIPEWNDAIYINNLQIALKRLLKTNPFPEFTGRVCPAPCEGSCTTGLNYDPVAIKDNERYIIDKAFDNNWITPFPPLIRTGKKVAVVGSGPSGLACAHQLNKYGHNVTVFERADRVGGLLMYGIPNMKLDKDIVTKRIEIMKAEGIEFLVNTEVGKTYPSENLLKEFDSVVLCCGSTIPRDISVKNRKLSGVHFAMYFLTSSIKHLLNSRQKKSTINTRSHLLAEGKDVIIIGGGDTGTDCVATALRQKCKSLVQFEILPKSSECRQENNPWPEWPKIYKKDYGHEEYHALFGKDPREFSIMAKEFIPDSNNHIKQVLTVNVKWEKNANGKLSPIELPGTEKYWNTQLVILCMGFIGPEENLTKQLGVLKELDDNTKSIYSTNVDGIFCAGDMRRGQSLVVLAIDEGLKAASACNEYLKSLPI